MFVPQRFRAVLVGVVLLLATGVVWASISGSISGVVTDPSGAVIPDVSVAAKNTQTGVQSTTKTDAKGFYEFPALPIGTYDVEVRQSGFRAFRQSGIVIDANSAVRVDVKLQIGAAAEEVTVTSDAVRVETQSTQLGELIEGSKITAMPLNGRAYTDLLSTQPGVVPSGYAKQVQNQLGGLTDRSVSGNLNPGNQSINGERQSANGFMVNGANVEEGKNNGTSIIPNLDSISEFRILTSNFDAEYGNFNGGQINVATKSGTNTFHGSAFEFLRNTVLDARNFFDTTGQVPDFKQNQFGGTFGGPIKSDKAFFFADYQGTRLVQGQTVSNGVPSLADRPDTPGNGGNANVVDLFNALLASGGSIGKVGGAFWATTLQTRLQKGGINETVTANEPYFFPGCTSASGTNPCVFPNAIIPASALSVPASHLLQFVPKPNAPSNTFNTSAFNQRLTDDKGGIRVDGNTRFGMLSAYYFMDDYLRDDPYPNSIVNGGGVAPGFDSVTPGRAQLISLGDTKSFGTNSVNEFHFSYMRSAGTYFKPKGGLGVTLASLGFNTPFNPNGGIGPIDPKVEGVPQVFLSNFGISIGVPQDTGRQVNNTFQWQDNFSKIIGTHSLKFGGQFHYDQINERNFFGENGAFTFDGSETGVDFVDFLLGAPASLIQASKQVLDSRSKYAGLYAQDSWRVTSDLTLNYGLRWEFSQPWYDTQGKTETIIPGEQSVLFPTAPRGWVVPGDPGVPGTLAPTKYDALSPRLGLAYSPSVQSGFLSKLTGGPGKMSIRAGFGIYYTSVEDLSQFLEVGDVPFGLFYVSPNPPLFDSPFIDRGTGSNEGQKFPFIIPAGNVSRQHPNTTFNWANVVPISSCFCFFPKNRLPYSNNYELSVQRQFGSKTILTANYVGNQGHKLATGTEASPGLANLCLELNQAPFNPTPGTQVCGPNGENPSSPGYVLPSGVGFPADTPAADRSTTTCLSGVGTCNVVTSTRILGPNFGENPYTILMANSAYNSLQVNLRHTGSLATFLVGYTYSKCMDNGSGLQDATSVFDPRKSRSLCAFDVTHNFGGSYSVRLPFDRAFHANSGWANKIAGGWSISGIATFATGIPVTIMEGKDVSLTGTPLAVDLPNVIAGKILNSTNPRRLDAQSNRIPYFSTGLFSPETQGQVGNANRRFFHGPGLNNWDMALLKDTRFTETKSLEFRFEAFNVFNHAQFQNPDGNIDDNSATGFGVVSKAYDARIMQAALKFKF
ncbi:MAG: TonB-dependent receptor [Candidatus Acidiferrales bacterium]